MSKNLLHVLRGIGLRTNDSPTDTLLLSINMNTSLAQCEGMGAVFYGFEQLAMKTTVGSICVGVEVFAILPYEISDDKKILLPVVGFSIPSDGMTSMRDTPSGLGWFSTSIINQLFFILDVPPGIENFTRVQPRVPLNKRLSSDDLRKIGRGT